MCVCKLFTFSHFSVEFLVLCLTILRNCLYIKDVNAFNVVYAANIVSEFDSCLLTLFMVLCFFAMQLKNYVVKYISLFFCCLWILNHSLKSLSPTLRLMNNLIMFSSSAFVVLFFIFISLIHLEFILVI